MKIPRFSRRNGRVLISRRRTLLYILCVFERGGEQRDKICFSKKKKISLSTRIVMQRPRGKFGNEISFLARIFNPSRIAFKNQQNEKNIQTDRFWWESNTSCPVSGLKPFDRNHDSSHGAVFLVVAERH